MTVLAHGMKPDTAVVQTETQDSSANSSQTVTVAGSSGRFHFVTGFEVAISGADASEDIFVTVEDDGTAIWKTVIGSGSARGERTGIAFSRPVRIGRGNDLTLVVTAGGASVVTHANLEYFTI